MSTTFHVYPATEVIPTFPQLLETATGHLSDFLRHYGVLTPASLDVAMRYQGDEENHDVPFDRNGPVWWPENQYAWFFVRGVPGGTDAYAKTMSDLDRECLVGEVEAEKAERLGDLPQASLRIGRYWYFRRSMGQLGITNIAYGILAASLAELTGGFLHSSDSAWDYRLLPARPAEFLKWYMRPEHTMDPDCKHWAQRCISSITCP
jgi:hypothetical protein